MTSRYNVLTPDDVEHFLEKGYVVVRGCFSRMAAAEFTAQIWDRLGYDEHDRSTWAEPSVHMPERRKLDVREFAPKAWGAVCDLVGGEDRIAKHKPYAWNDAFIVNLWQGGDRPWEPASPSVPGWHKDGDFFRHYLDSPEQGLLTLVLWSDVRHQGGATFVAADSVGPVARFLADHPQGSYPADYPTRPEHVPVLPYDELAGQCREFVEAIGEVGDVYLLHPYILHAKAQNVLRVPRYITNPPLTLAEPMRFDRAGPDDFSLVERAVLRALGVQRYDFAPAGPREALVPPRIARQRQMLADEQRRLVS
jgi:Phytanoyl-CoA dioxygenase (PhyH)